VLAAAGTKVVLADINEPLFARDRRRHRRDRASSTWSTRTRCNKLEIVVTLHGRNIYRMQRMFPALVERLTARQFDDIRNTRDKVAGE
jgi:hypothetical protein